MRYFVQTLNVQVSEVFYKKQHTILRNTEALDVHHKTTNCRI